MVVSREQPVKPEMQQRVSKARLKLDDEEGTGNGAKVGAASKKQKTTPPLVIKSIPLVRENPLDSSDALKMKKQLS